MAAINVTSNVPEDGNLTGDVVTGSSSVSNRLASVSYTDRNGNPQIALFPNNDNDIVIVTRYGTLTIDRTGDFTYDPDNSLAAVENLNDGDSLAESFSYTGTAGSGTANLTIQGNTDDAPVTGGDGSASGSEDDASIAGNVPAASDADPGDVITYELVSGSVTVDGNPAPDGTVTLNSDGSYSYDPSGDQDLDDGGTRIIEFDYIATDGTLDSAAATITITVNGANDAPVTGGGDSASGTEDDSSIGGDVPDATDPDDAVTYSLVSGSVTVDGSPAADGTVTVNSDGTYSYDPSGDQGLDDGGTRVIEFDYISNDGDADSAAATVTITVNGANDAPVTGGIDSASGSEDDVSIDGAVPAASDADTGDTVTYSLVSGSVTIDGSPAADGTVTFNSDGTYSYDPSGDQDLAAGDTRIIEFQYIATDGTDDSAASTVTITVNGATDIVTLTGTPDPDTLTGTDPGNEYRIDGLASDDVLTGNALHDEIDGGDGNDELLGAAGDDTLTGGIGNDKLKGGTGADDMTGGDGNDTYVVDNAGDSVTESAGEGTNDKVKSSITYTLGANVEELTLTGTGAIDGTGNSLSNLITGNDQANVLDDGGDGDDTLYGMGGDDSLTGGAGKDILNGGTGADSMAGGDGRDTYVVDDAGDSITELAGQGRDLVQSGITYTLGSEVDDLTLTGTSDLDGTGNGLANAINGNSGANTLDGGDGNDTLKGHDGVDNLIGGNGADRLDGGAGADTMTGGANSDTYFVDDSGDVIVENAGEGNGDRVEASASYTLSGNVEDLTLTGTADIDGAGNDGANILTGNSGANQLNGNGANDTLYGNSGNDVLIGDAGDDQLRGGNDDDSLYGGSGKDLLVGGAGADGFYFDGPLDAASRDNIKDFDVADDTIYLDRSVFTGFAADGAIDADAFHLGTAAADAEDRILYDSATGKVYYDSDGDGAAAAVLFAQVAAGTALSELDFVAYTPVI